MRHIVTTCTINHERVLILSPRFASHQYVIALNIAVQSVLVVHERQRLQDLPTDVRDVRLLEIYRGAQSVRQRSSLHVVHGDHHLAVRWLIGWLFRYLIGKLIRSFSDRQNTNKAF